MPQKFWKYKNHIVFYTQLAILILTILVINLVSVGWDWTKIKYITFGMMTFISLYSKIIGTNYSSNLELLPKLVDGKETNEVVLLEKTIIESYHKLLAENRTGKFKSALNYVRLNYRLKNEIDIMDSKSLKSDKFKFNEFNIEKRKILHELLYLLQTKKLTEFDEMLKTDRVIQHININKLSWKSMKRSNMKMVSLFSTKTSNCSDEFDFSDNKVTFNKWSYSFKTQFVFLITMPILSLIYSGFFVDEYFSSKQIWIDILGYSFSLAMGVFNGISIGTDAIQKGYLAKLQKRVETIQEVLNIEAYLPKQVEEKGA